MRKELEPQSEISSSTAGFDIDSVTSATDALRPSESIHLFMAERELLAHLQKVPGVFSSYEEISSLLRFGNRFKEDSSEVRDQIGVYTTYLRNAGQPIMTISQFGIAYCPAGFNFSNRSFFVLPAGRRSKSRSWAFPALS